MHASNAVRREARFSGMENREHCKGRRMRKLLCVYSSRGTNLSEHKVSVATLNFMQRTVTNKRKDNQDFRNKTYNSVLFSNNQNFIFAMYSKNTLYCVFISIYSFVLHYLPNITKVWKIKVEVPTNLQLH